jgi:hypothetical protein
MTDEEYDRALSELDRVFNDPEVAIEPDRIWSLLANVVLGARCAQAVGSGQA